MMYFPKPESAKRGGGQGWVEGDTRHFVCGLKPSVTSLHLITWCLCLSRTTCHRSPLCQTDLACRDKESVRETKGKAYLGVLALSSAVHKCGLLVGMWPPGIRTIFFLNPRSDFGLATASHKWVKMKLLLFPPSEIVLFLMLLSFQPCLQSPRAHLYCVTVCQPVKKKLHSSSK